MTEAKKILFEVQGMMKKGSITGTGGPDAIVSALEGSEGIERITCLVDTEAFELWYIPTLISLRRIFEKIQAVGKKNNLPYGCSTVIMATHDEKPGVVKLGEENGMKRVEGKGKTYFVCEKCGFRYLEKGWAKKCEAWCSGHRSCNLQITGHAVQGDGSLSWLLGLKKSP